MKLIAPPLTVALLTYNRLHYLKESLGAILAQNYENFELLVLDNYSTDGTGEFILGLQDPRIRYIRNSGQLSTVQFNCLSAYHLALGHRVIVTHDDDIMESDMLERQMRFMDSHPNVRLVWTRVSDIDQDGEVIADAEPAGEDRVFAPGEYITSFLKERLWPMPSGVMMERSCLPKGYSMEALFNPRQATLKNPMDAAGIADVLMPAQVNSRSAIGYLNQPLLRRRVHTNQFTHSASLSRPGVYLYRRLYRIASFTPGLREQALHFQAFVARFEIQEAITTNDSPTVRKRTVTRVRDIAARLVAHMASSPDAYLAGLPILLLNQLVAPGEGLGQLEALQTGEHDSATRQYLAWARNMVRAPEAGLFDTFAGRRVVIFGSAFVAALLVLEARRQGQRVAACIDSNVNRQGRRLLGVPIESLAWMREQVVAEDVIIISSERDHEAYIESIIRQNLQAPASIVSWKILIE